ncbi:DUF5723 family protein [uncultured Planktosalinus sp.]|uniref:DUF5723 family protein n=1 Tax=uncultured Planktosalinus sp. TaxID=1810935 RepID=UPI0030D85B4A
MKFLSICWIILIGFTGVSQNKQLLYGVKDIPQSLLLNPGGIVQYDKHFGIPFLSHIHFNGGASGVTVYDIFQNSITTNINNRITQAIFNQKNTDFFTVTQQLEIINFGWRNNQEYYFSGGVYQEFDMITYFPRDLAILGWEGNANYIDYEFDLADLNTSGDLLTVYHFGANKKVTDKLTLGARIKVYSSIFNFRSTNNKGTFVTRAGDGSQNIYDHLLQNADVQMQTSGFASLIESDNESPNVGGHVVGRAFFGGNLGIGIDIGATYELTNNWVVSASLLDVGAIFHTNEVENYRAHGSYNLTGLNLIFPSLEEGEATLPYYQNLEDEITEQVPIDTLYNKYTVMRPMKMNAELMYHFGESFSNKECDCLDMGKGDFGNQAVGLQLNSIFRPKKPQYAATLFYYRRFTDFLAGKITYTADSFSIDNVGLLAVGDFGKLNVYIGIDNLLRYGNLAKANHVSLQLGLNLKYL